MRRILFAIAAMLAGGSAFAEDTAGSPGIKGLKLELNAGNASTSEGGGVTLDYQYRRTFGGAYRQWGGDVTQIWQPRAKLEASGSVALLDENPQDFSELKLDLGADLDSLLGENSVIQLGTFYAQEGNEKFDDHQAVYGGTLALATKGALTQNALRDDLLLRLSYGSVDPSGDESRKALLGNQMEDFDRVHLRAEYAYRLDNAGPVHKVELTYNEYREQNAPALIRAAGLDEYSYSTIALYLPNNFALTFGEGKLPFDLEDSRIVQLGFQIQPW